MSIQTVSPIDCEFCVDIWALDDVLVDPVLRLNKADCVFRSLIDATATRIAEGFFKGERIEEGQTVDLVSEGKVSRLHLLVKRKGLSFTALVVTFQFEHCTPSIITDGLVLVQGDRQLVARFIAYRDHTFSGPILEQLPAGPFSDRAPVCPQRRPQRGAKPMIHRAIQNFLSWGRTLRKKLRLAVDSLEVAVQARIGRSMTSLVACYHTSEPESSLGRSLEKLIVACSFVIFLASRTLAQILTPLVRLTRKRACLNLDIRLPTLPGGELPDLADIHGIKPGQAIRKSVEPELHPAKTLGISGSNLASRRGGGGLSQGRAAHIAKRSGSLVQPPSQSRPQDL